MLKRLCKEYMDKEADWKDTSQAITNEINEYIGSVVRDIFIVGESKIRIGYQPSLIRGTFKKIQGSAIASTNTRYISTSTQQEYLQHHRIGVFEILWIPVFWFLGQDLHKNQIRTGILFSCLRRYRTNNWLILSQFKMRLFKYFYLIEHQQHFFDFSTRYSWIL